MANKLAAGTRFRLVGSNESDPILVLAKDAEIKEVSDQEMVGTIIDDQENWDLNIKSIPGRFSRATGARTLNECACGNEIPASAADQETCATCLADPSKAERPERRGIVKDRRVQAQPLNDAPERREGVADRRAPIEPLSKFAAAKTAAKKAAKKSAPKASKKKAAKAR